MSYRALCFIRAISSTIICEPLLLWCLPWMIATATRHDDDGLMAIISKWQMGARPRAQKPSALCLVVAKWCVTTRRRCDGEITLRPKSCPGNNNSMEATTTVGTYIERGTTDNLISLTLLLVRNLTNRVVAPW